MQTMRAIEYHAPGDIRVSTVAMPKCANDEIRAKVDACAICGTDLKTYVHGNTRIKPPKIIGHEFTAIVETAGKNVEGFEIGQRIVMATSISCGRCFYCSEGHTNLCLDLAPMGFTYNGGMAEYVTIPAEKIATHILALEKILKGFDLMKSGQALRVVLKP